MFYCQGMPDKLSPCRWAKNPQSPSNIARIRPAISHICLFLQHNVATKTSPLTLYLSAVKNQKTLFFPLSPVSLLLGVIQRSNKIIMDDRQTIFGRQSVSLHNFFVAEDIVHYLPKFVATWNPP